MRFILTRNVPWLIPIIISLPVAWMVINKWLDNFAYRITLDWWIFALSGFIALLIAFVTVNTQAVKVAITNPVKSLRLE